MTLPIGFTVRINRRTRLLEAGRVLVGGSPTTVLALTGLARAVLTDRVIRITGEPSARLARLLLDRGMADPVVEALPDLDVDVTVVIPIRDRPVQLDRLLASVPGGLRVIVVDDGSRRPELVAAVARRHGAELLPLPVNVGPAGARNAGLARVATQFVAFVDSDIVLDPDAIRILLRHFADPGVGLAVPRVAAYRRGGSEGWIARYEAGRSSLDLGTEPASIRPRSTVSWASSACVVARVAAIGSGFDDTMRVGEDVDLVWRLVDAGWRARYEPAATAYHDHRIAFWPWLRRKFFYGTSAEPLAQRHSEHIAPAVLAPWGIGLAVVLLAQRWWSIPAALGITAFTANRIARKLPIEHPRRWGAVLAARGVANTLGQFSALLLRHWWPVTAIAAIRSRRIRRAVLVAAVADAVVEYAKSDRSLDPLRFGVARRLDDLAYGAGVWWSAIRRKSFAALRPALSPATEARRGGVSDAADPQHRGPN